ncbi:hypothetical protein AHAS_Ahas19G0364900 [Arachis hypogaea]
MLRMKDAASEVESRSREGASNQAYATLLYGPYVAVYLDVDRNLWVVDVDRNLGDEKLITDGF